MRSGLFLMKRSISAQAASVSPRKVRFAQIKGLEFAAKALIAIKRVLLFPTITTRAKQSKNIVSNIRFILYGNFIILDAIKNLIND